ncbi:group II intron maturase-specific domain-containing protein [Desertibacillus haloalkaliphilus]|uniref:group II intron maturase-specific domain-containing protein n=1 Tax=Desertibacillus haloalkaliphilus TaxID=1328930 RepID=UPI001C25F004|nr:hypothetical protein [Desertibacillus haloalkaliphilus]
MESITSFIENKLKLKVNREKSSVDRPWKRKFLGFSFTVGREPKIRIAKESINRLKQRIRELTSRRHSIEMSKRLRKLNRFLTGWLVYYQLIDTPSVLAKLDAWIRRRLRMIRWKEWKTISARKRNLIKQGISKARAWEWANSRKGYWRIAQSPIMNRALGDQYWSNQGLISLAERYQTKRWT